jgi:thiosulfate/3-mercaptopyruvate sulfurtransferase
MKCTDCHGAGELHGDYGTLGYETNETPNHRYSGVPIPSCVSCHESATLAENENISHQLHNQRLSCQVCHSVSYSNCAGCHVQVSEDTGRPFFETEGSYLTFLIGRNPIKSEERPYDYVPVRHVPIAPTSYQYYGENLLPNFDVLPTWTYATPHNIQRETPQNTSCESCHGHPEVFLTADTLMENELTANQEVVVETIPPPVEQILAGISNLPEDHVNYPTCRECHESGGEVPALPENHRGYFYPTCGFCHTNP